MCRGNIPRRILSRPLPNQHSSRQPAYLYNICIMYGKTKLNMTFKMKWHVTKCKGSMHTMYNYFLTRFLSNFTPLHYEIPTFRQLKILYNCVLILLLFFYFLGNLSSFSYTLKDHFVQILRNL